MYHARVSDASGEDVLAVILIEHAMTTAASESLDGVGGVQKDVRVTRSLSLPTGAPRRTQTRVSRQVPHADLGSSILIVVLVLER